MGVIDDFVHEYERQFDFWEASARIARDALEAELNSSGARDRHKSRKDGRAARGEAAEAEPAGCLRLWFTDQ